VWVSGQQVDRLDTQSSGVALQGTERDVALTAFETTDVGAVQPEEVGERLLGQPALLTIEPQVVTQPSLELALHTTSVLGVLLEGLQTYK
jgi:hypothetical protein